MADSKKAPNKPENKDAGNAPAQEEGRKVNPWIPIAVVAVIVALIAVMAAISGNTNNTGTTDTNQAASGTTQSGDTADAPQADVSWITLDTTPNQVVEKAGIPAKMLQQLISVTDADMDKPFKDIGGEETISKVASVVAQFGGGAMGGGSDTSAPSGMGGTTTTP